ncbi:MAG TPA: glutaminyl-peptide cyclotransferase [Sedimentisphaerales bacterium]|nr:glutaminyl-peptide cyclotransferase [Sedimentisphaerales bacterium]
MRQGIFQSRGLMRRSSTVLFLILAAGNLVWLSAISSSHVWAQESAKPMVHQYEYRVVQSYPHDRQAFTQGLVYEAGVLYEGTGLYGRSTLVKRDLKTGQALKTTHLARNHFGEGITIFGEKIIQLTWRNKVGFVYRKDTFTLLKEFTYPTEGWGLTHDGQRLIYSDGTATLRFLDPNTFAQTGRIEVRNEGRPVRGLNELEYIEGQVFANVWPTDEIVAIDPKTGQVVGCLDLSTLYPRPDNSEEVLNGIAWIPESKRLLVTGKLWPRVYEIELIDRRTGESQQ